MEREREREREREGEGEKKRLTFPINLSIEYRVIMLRVKKMSVGSPTYNVCTLACLCLL